MDADEAWRGAMPGLMSARAAQAPARLDGPVAGPDADGNWMPGMAREFAPEHCPMEALVLRIIALMLGMQQR